MFLAEGSQPVTEKIGIDPRLYPGTPTAFDSDLHEHPSEELRRIGQAMAELALGPAGLAALRERRRESSAPIGIAAAAVGHGRLYVGAGRKRTRLKNLAMLEVYE